jgi:EAL domain-containing protein (putative c-di-GMP-specific phosphodiesterase class I)
METGLSAQYLELELTESLLLSNVDIVLATLQNLKEMGLQLAIDDFGTGYSSLSYLKQFPVDKLKIDRSFIRDIAVDPDDAAITNAIISMARSMHLKVIAEGVENEVQLSFLREHECDQIQGYYFSKPVPADEATSIQFDQGYRTRRGRTVPETLRFLSSGIQIAEGDYPLHSGKYNM